MAWCGLKTYEYCNEISCCLLETMKQVVLILLTLCFLLVFHAAAKAIEAETEWELHEEVGLLFGTGQYERAIEVAAQSLKVAEQNAGVNDLDVAVSLNKLALLYKAKGDYERAEPLYERSLSIRENALGSDHPDVAQSLNNLAALYKSQGNYQQAEWSCKQSQLIREKALGLDHPEVAQSLNSLAVIYKVQGKYSQAEPLYKRSLSIREKAFGPDHPEVAQSLNSLAGLYHSQGKYSQAELLYKRSLAIREKVLGPDHPDVATSLESVATYYKVQGNYAQSEPLYKRSLAIREKVFGSEHPHVATSLSNLAGIYDAQGSYAQAEPLYKRSLAIREKAFPSEHPTVAQGISNLALIYQRYGNYAEAEPLLWRSLAIREKVFGPDHPKVAQSLYGLATIYYMQGNYAQAESLYKRSLAIKEKVLGSEHPDVATGLDSVAALLLFQGKYSPAESLYKRSLAIKEKALGLDHPDVAEILSHLSHLYQSQGNYGSAESLIQRSQTIAQGAGKPGLLYHVQYTYAKILEKQSKSEASIFFAKQSVNTIQGVRKNVSELGKEAILTFDKTVEKHFQFLARLLIEQGRLPEAQQVQELLKEQEFFQFVRRNPKETALMSERTLLTSFEAGQERRLQNDAKPLIKLFASRTVLQEKSELSLEEKKSLLSIDKEIEKASNQYIETLKAVVAAFSEPRAREVEDVKVANGLQDDLRALGKDVVALYTVMENDGYYLQLITPEFRKAYSNPIPAAELSGKIHALRAQLTNPQADPRSLARELYGILLEPAVADLEKLQATTLLWHLDGSLRYLPMSALHDGKGYLVEKYRNIIYTAASKPSLKDKPNPSWQGLGLGTSQARSVDGYTFQALPAVPKELAAVIRENKQEGIVPGISRLDDAFTRELLEKSLASKGRYPLVHIASHFLFVPGNDTQSFLLLGDGTPLRLSDVEQKDNLFGGVDLLTLSACETAIGGGRNATGKEVDGLSIMAQRQGAKAVLATLWPVADNSTARLMSQFYRLRDDGKVSKGESLRQAQLSLLHGEVKPGDQPSGLRNFEVVLNEAKKNPDAPPFVPDPKKQYAHPYFWAPFTLVGNWL